MRLSAILPVLLAPLLFAGLGQTTRTTAQGPSSSISFMSSAAAAPLDSTQVIRVGAPYWAEAKMETEVLRQVLTDAGYKVNIMNLGVPLVLQGMCDNEIDYWVDAWIPSNIATLKPFYAKGCITKAGTTLSGAQYDIVVPDYVYNAGVHSMADLNKYANQFQHKMYGLEPSTAGNKLIKAAIASNKYNLKDWTLVESSEASMLSAVKNHINTHQWIAFFGYKPHWMNSKYHIKYLADPLNVWGKDYHVDGIARKGYLKANPNIGRFLRQLKFDVKDVSDWTYANGIKRVPADQVAKKWIASHLNVVGQWLNGVKTANGQQPAINAVRQAVQHS